MEIGQAGCVEVRRGETAQHYPASRVCDVGMFQASTGELHGIYIT